MDDLPSTSCETAGLFRRSALSWCEGRLDIGLQFAEAAVDVDCADNHEFCEVSPFWHVALLIKAREIEAAWRALHALDACGHAAAAESPGPPQSSRSPRMVATAHVFRGELLFVTGHAEEGLAEVSTGLRIAERHGVRSLRPTGYVVLALAALRRADMRACLAFVDKLAGEALLGYFGQAAGAWVTAQATEARSGVDSAAGLIAGIVTSPLVLRQLLVSEPGAASWLVRACGMLGAHELATTAAAVAASVAAAHPRFTVLRAAALHATGLIEGDVATLLEAANLYPDQWCAASAREDLAGVLAKRPTERGATVLALETALTAYTAVGATRDASRVVNRLRELGVRRGTVRTGDRERARPNGLTNTEFAVAELVSQGHTNNEVGRQLFISRHTVAFHLKKVYQKMSVTSRVELAASWKAMR
jgi:DNA-binding CsgD family transcriptional regulator